MKHHRHRLLVSAAALLVLGHSLFSAPIRASLETDYYENAEGDSPLWEDATGTGEWNLRFGSAFVPGEADLAFWNGEYFGNVDQFFDFSGGKLRILPGDDRSFVSAIIEWTSGVSGIIHISGKIALIEPCETGVRFGVFKNDEKILTLPTVTIPGQIRNISAETTVEVSVEPDDRIFFIVDSADDINTGEIVHFVEQLRITGETR